MVACEIRPGTTSTWECVTHQCRMDGEPEYPPSRCFVADQVPHTRAEKDALLKEQRLLMYRHRANTLTKTNRERLVQLKILLS